MTINCFWSINDSYSTQIYADPINNEYNIFILFNHDDQHRFKPSGVRK